MNKEQEKLIERMLPIKVKEKARLCFVLDIQDTQAQVTQLLHLEMFPIQVVKHGITSWHSFLQHTYLSICYSFDA